MLSMVIFKTIRGFSQNINSLEPSTFGVLNRDTSFVTQHALYGKGRRQRLQQEQ